MMLNVSNMDVGVTVGLYLLASFDLEEAVFVGYNGSSLFIDTRNSAQNTSTFQTSFRTVLVAPFAIPAKGILQLRVWLDQTVIEVFASDCTCGSNVVLPDCDCSESEVALAITALGFPLRPSATNSGLYASCDGRAQQTPAPVEDNEMSSKRRSGTEINTVIAAATVWPIDAAPVECKPPMCMSAPSSIAH